MSRGDRAAAAALTFKQRCKSAPPLNGCFLNLASAFAAELVAASGYDCVLIDREHSPTGLMTALPMLYAARSAGSAVLLRVPANGPAEIKRAVDLGVDGLMIPLVESAEDARRAVEAAYYPPAGRRGMAPGVVRASGFGQDPRYVAEAAERLLLMCQIESGRGVDAVAEIAAVPGVDLLFVGPYDLSADQGHPGEPDHPEVRRQIERIEAACRAARIAIGGIPTPKRAARELFAAGYALVLSGSDVGFLREGAQADLRSLAEALAATHRQ